VRYGEAALLAAVLQDDLLAASLYQLFIEPLTYERDEGAMALETLCAYFASERNAASAAAVLGVSRQAVNGRLRMIEERLGRTINGSGPELEVALRVRDLEDRQPHPGHA
jgi:DNA-binding PucR family transcriptional regulator